MGFPLASSMEINAKLGELRNGPGRKGLGDAGWQLIVPLALPIALLLLDPGAYSIDAKRYGRRVIASPTR